jgi:membrane carboxypeptidase/penicillin-binding protein
MMKTAGKIILFMAAVILAVLVYCCYVVIRARLDTPGILKKALSREFIRVEPADITKWQVDALLAVEDPNFYNHHGVDLKTPGAGLTTITQGLVKIFYFSDFKPGFAKLKQTLIARFALDPLVTKQDQLKLFVNFVYLGKCKDTPIHGFAEAAQCYYEKAVKQLTQDEYLSIIAMIIAPKNFGIEANPGANRERVSRIKKVLSGEYAPKGLMDVYYGQLDTETQKGLAPASYIKEIYKK